jgi:serine/threonine protein kinase
MVEDDQGELKTLEHYTLFRKLGDGTFGIGYLAKDTQNDLTCCVKVFKDMDESSDKTFRAEV